MYGKSEAGASPATVYPAESNSNAATPQNTPNTAEMQNNAANPGTNANSQQETTQTDELRNVRH